MPADEPFDYSNYFLDSEIQNLIQAQVINMEAPRPAKPKEAPKPPRHWVDRETTLTELEAHFTSGDCIPVVVTGPGGIGKSSLAGMLAVLLDRRFPDGQLYIDLGADDPLTAMRQALIRLGVAKDSLTESLSGLLSQYRSATSDKALLVIVDEAPSRDAAVLFEPASGDAGFLVLGRDWPEDFEVLRHQLDRLAAEHAARFLVNICPELTESQAAQHIAGLHWSPQKVRALAGFIRALQKAQAGRQPDRRAVLDYSTAELIDATRRMLSESASWLYRLLRSLPADEIERPMLAAVGPEAVELFRELIDAQLASEIRPDRYRIEGVTDDTGTGFPIELAHTVKAVLGWHIKRAQLADRAIMGEQRLRLAGLSEVAAPGFEQSEEALRWLRDNHRMLTGFVRVAAVVGWDEEAWMLAEAMWALFTNLPYPEVAAQCYRTAADAADAPDTKARMLICLGRTLIDLHEYAESDAILSEAVRLATAAGAEPLIGSAAEQLGWLYYKQGRLDEAEAMYSTALEYAERQGRRRSQALQLKLLGFVHRDRREADRARLSFVKALGGFVSIGDARNTAIVRAELALLDVAVDPLLIADADTAIRHLRELGLAAAEAEALERLGGILDGGDGRARLEAALEIYERIGSAKAERLRGLLG